MRGEGQKKEIKGKVLEEMGENSVDNTGETGLRPEEEEAPRLLQERGEVDHGRLMGSVIGVPTGLNPFCLDTFVNLQTGPRASGHTLPQH